MVPRKFLKESPNSKKKKQHDTKILPNPNFYYDGYTPSQSQFHRQFSNDRFLISDVLT